MAPRQFPAMLYISFCLARLKKADLRIVSYNALDVKTNI
jgi:hypothetical protein